MCILEFKDKAIHSILIMIRGVNAWQVLHLWNYIISQHQTKSYEKRSDKNQNISALPHTIIAYTIVIHVSLAKITEEIDISWTNIINFTLTIIYNVTTTHTHSLGWAQV